MASKDTVFDGIAGKFSANIYQTTKGELRQTLLEEALEPYLKQLPLRVLDIGGGTGVMSRYLSEMGCSVVLSDASKDVLKEAKQNLSPFPNVEIRQQYLQQIDDIDHFDLVICHAVFEWLSEPLDALSLLFNKMRSGAVLSLSFFNRDAALFGNAVYGNFDLIEKGMQVKNKVKLNTHNPLRPPDVLVKCESLGFDVRSTRGIRCFHDYLKDRSMQLEKFDALLSLERQYHEQSPYKWLGKYFHLFAVKP